MVRGDDASPRSPDCKPEIILLPAAWWLEARSSAVMDDDMVWTSMSSLIRSRAEGADVFVGGRLIALGEAAFACLVCDVLATPSNA